MKIFNVCDRHDHDDRAHGHVHYHAYDHDVRAHDHVYDRGCTLFYVHAYLHAHVCAHAHVCDRDRVCVHDHDAYDHGRLPRLRDDRDRDGDPCHHGHCHSSQLPCQSADASFQPGLLYGISDTYLLAP